MGWWKGDQDFETCGHGCESQGAWCLFCRGWGGFEGFKLPLVSLFLAFWLSASFVLEGDMASLRWKWLIVTILAKLRQASCPKSLGQKVRKVSKASSFRQGPHWTLMAPFHSEVSFPVYVICALHPPYSEAGPQTSSILHNLVKNTESLTPSPTFKIRV